MLGFQGISVVPISTITTVVVVVPGEGGGGGGLAVADYMFTKLRAQGKTGVLSDMLNENTYWRALAGGSALPLNDVKKLVLRGLGYTGSVPDMEKAYWSA